VFALARAALLAPAFADEVIVHGRGARRERRSVARRHRRARLGMLVIAVVTDEARDASFSIMPRD
jgi:hypothetical protein